MDSASTHMTYFKAVLRCFKLSVLQGDHGITLLKYFFQILLVKIEIYNSLILTRTKMNNWLVGEKLVLCCSCYYVCLTRS